MLDSTAKARYKGRPQLSFNTYRAKTKMNSEINELQVSVSYNEYNSDTL